MRSKQSALLLLNYGCKREFHSSPNQSWRASIEEKATKIINPQNSTSFSIYKVPQDIFEVEPKAYTPNIISIGPYHYGKSSLQGVENLKWSFFQRLKDTTRAIHFDAVEELEEEDRGHYVDEFNLSRDDFLQMMVLDGCFIIELLRELDKYKFKHGSPWIERWMLPALCRDLIKIENQLPLSVLQKLFKLTSSNSFGSNAESLHVLALKFFSPLLVRNVRSMKAILIQRKRIFQNN